MGLGKFTQADSGSSSGNNGSGGSSSSGSSYTAKHPQFSIEQYEDGSWAFKKYPNTAPLRYKDGKIESTPPELQKYWMDSTQFKMICNRVEDRFGEDLLEMLEEGRVEQAADLITEAAKRKNSAEGPKKARMHRDCAVCDEELHLRYGDYEKIDGSIVCTRHNVRELKDAGVL